MSRSWRVGQCTRRSFPRVSGDEPNLVAIRAEAE